MFVVIFLFQPAKSDGKMLQLQSVTFNSTGSYLCEVLNNDSPVLAVKGEAYMEVIGELLYMAASSILLNMLIRFNIEKYEIVYI